MNPIIEGIVRDDSEKNKPPLLYLYLRLTDESRPVLEKDGPISIIFDNVHYSGTLGQRTRDHNQVYVHIPLKSSNGESVRMPDLLQRLGIENKDTLIFEITNGRDLSYIPGYVGNKQDLEWFEKYNP